MPKSRDKSYWRSYRRLRTNVAGHIDSVYDLHVEESYPDSSPHINELVHVDAAVSETNEINIPPSELANSSEQSIFTWSDSYSEHAEFNHGDSDLSDNLEKNDFDLSLEDQLSVWASRYNIAHSALRDLLKILHPYHEYLPKDPRTLLQTQRQVEVVEISGGHYHHFGIENGIKCQVLGVLSLFTKSQETIGIQVNIDGVPLFKSSNTQFWPILGRIIEPFSAEPFIIGIFVGEKKPSDIHSFLRDFVEEMKALEQNGIHIEHLKCDVFVAISCVICDTPARAFVKQVKGHSGYFGCDKCVQRGVWEGKMTFPDINAELRTDCQFDEMSQIPHHLGQSPFNKISLGMVSQFPLDYMHLVCLGVMKRLLLIWVRGPRGSRKIASSSVERISANILNLRKYLPKEFLRKGRSLCDIDRWKASEFRQFMLYTGPICLQGILSSDVYRHFMLLFVSIYCLCSRFYYKDYVMYSNELIRLFVEDYGKLYGQDMITYNVHGLIHLANDVKKFGPLENFSAFVFESFLARLKRMVRKPNFPLQQVVRRLSENSDLNFSKDTVPPTGKVRLEHRNGPLPQNALNGLLQFAEISLPDVFLSLKDGDNCVLVEKRVALVRNIICANPEDEKEIVYEEFLNANNFFEYPLESKDLMIFSLSELSGETKVCKVSDIACKCVLIPFKNVFVSIPLVHTS